MSKINGDALLHLADHPVVPSEVIPKMLLANNNKAIIPTCNGKGGHPVLIPQTLINHFWEWEGEGGLRQFWQDHPDLVSRLPIENAEEMLIDLDTPEDYAKHHKN